MLKGPDPDGTAIDRPNLDYTAPSSLILSLDHKFSPDIERFKASSEAAEFVLHSQQFSDSLRVLFQSTDATYLTWLYQHSCRMWMPRDQINRRSWQLRLSVAREGIKSSNKVCDVLSSSIRNIDDITMIKDRLIRRKKFPNKLLVTHDPAGRDTWHGHTSMGAT